MKKVFVGLLLLIAISLLANAVLGIMYATSRTRNNKLITKIRSQKNQVNFAASGRQKIIQSYIFAQENQGPLKTVDCYCGCQNPKYGIGHKNLANCFVKKIIDGRIIYDDHGQYCSICMNETMDVKRWLETDKHYSQLKILIDKKYKNSQRAK